VRPSTRKIALSLFVCVVVLTAGCSGIQGTESSSTTLNVANQDDVDHAVVVEIGDLADDPNPDYTAGRTLNGESDVELEPFEGTGEYEVAVTVDGETTVLTHTFAPDDDAVTIGIDNQGNVTIE
jgi:hypothetical protein